MGASPYHGVGGPMAVADTTDPYAGHLAFLEAARELGFAADPQWDFNGATQENGAGFYQKNLKDGRRHSAATGYLAPVLNRPDLVVRPFSQVRRLLFTGTRVTGVEYVRGRATPGTTPVVERVRVEREVIVSAGAIGTPKVLMLSGIGPADHLRSHGIPLILDLPGVGANLHDHPRIGFRWAGLTSLPGSLVSAGLLTHSVRGVNPGAPDLQFYVGRGLSAPDTAITFSVTVSRPHSRGSITLRSADPLAAPAIRAGYFTDARDMDASIMPTVVNAQTHAACVLIGERAAELLRA